MNALPPSNKAASLRRLITRHPYISVLTLLIIFILVSQLIGIIFLWVHLPLLAEIPLVESVLALVIALLITIPGWWSDAGFTGGFDRHTPIICLGAILLIGLPLLASIPLLRGKGSPSLALIAIVVALVVGFVEEGLFRGLILSILLPKGILLSVILSSMLFACIHIINLLSGFPLPYVIGQMLMAFGIGILFAAIRLRTASIWPTIFLHALRDVGGLLLLFTNPRQVLSIFSFSSLSLIIISNSIYCLFFIISAAILLRPRKLRLLQIKYGLYSPNTYPTSEQDTDHNRM